MTGTPPISPRNTLNAEMIISNSGQKVLIYRMDSDEKSDEEEDFLDLGNDFTLLSLREVTFTPETWQDRFKNIESEEDLKTYFDFSVTETGYGKEIVWLKDVKSYFVEKNIDFDFPDEPWQQICALANKFNKLPSEIIKE